MSRTLGAWITDGTAAPFYARKQFRITKPVQSARASVCGLGQFVFYVNGKKAGDHELDPGWTNYRRLIQYVTFDVTKDLAEGENVIGAEVGNGWFIKTDEHYTFSFPKFMPPNPNPYQAYGKSLVLALELSIKYTDGSIEVIHADDTFAVHKHPVVMSNVYGSETIDGRLRQDGWCTAAFDASGWEAAQAVAAQDEPKGRLIEQFQPAVKVIAAYDGKYVGTVLKTADPAETGGSVKTPGIEREIYDFGQNMSGILEFEACGKAGDEIRVYPAEKLAPDGDVDQMAKGWVMVDSCITYLIGQDDAWETCRMKFTYFAGRYVAVEKGQASLRSLKAYAVTSAWKTDGAFHSDDERYNRIYQMIEKTVEANMLSVHTDCPTIERFAWQEPNHLMAPSIFYMKDGKKLWEKFLLDMRTQQHTAEDYFLDYDGNRVYPGDGLMPSQCPCYIPNVLPVPGMGSFYDIIPWGSTCILGTYWHYLFYGDKKIIEDNYEAGRRYLEHLKGKVDAEGFISHGLGDWGNPKQELARENVETVFLYADAKTLAYFAGILCRDKEQAELEAYAAEVREHYNQKLLVRHPEKGFWCYRIWQYQDQVKMTQAAEALPLYWGMVPKEKEADVAKAFLDTLEQEQAFVSGEVGLPYIIQTAAKYKMNDKIAQFITRTEHPSYYAFVLDGMTTLGEYWESNPRSHCHDMMGHIIEWYYHGIAGIQPKEPGFRRVRICPYLPEGMGEFTCTYRSVNGEIQVHVKECGEEIVLETKVPQGVAYEEDLSHLLLRGKCVRVQM
ncbi:MAG: glycoside hydrolase family 78 protein [Eubacterium sp.]|nr:glycoside hydrolase family 78 protein [Eubacterium sp.]